MPLKQPTYKSNVPNKGDTIINPRTGRPVKVGGKSWLKMVSEGLVEGHYQSARVTAPVTAPIKKQIAESVNRNTSPNTSAKNMSRIAASVLRNNIDEIVNTDGDIGDVIERLIIANLESEAPPGNTACNAQESPRSSRSSPPHKKRSAGRPRKEKPPVHKAPVHKASINKWIEEPCAGEASSSCESGYDSTSYDTE
jgi:hypothetical protein